MGLQVHKSIHLFSISVKHPAFVFLVMLHQLARQSMNPGSTFIITDAAILRARTNLEIKGIHIPPGRSGFSA